MIKYGEYTPSKYSPFSSKHFDRYKAKVSHVTLTDSEKAHQVDSNVERKLHAKFHKDERNFST